MWLSVAALFSLTDGIQERQRHCKDKGAAEYRKSGASLALNLGPALTPGQASDLPSAGQASLSACLAVYGMCGACVEHVWSA